MDGDSLIINTATIENLKYALNIRAIDEQDMSALEAIIKSVNLERKGRWENKSGWYDTENKELVIEEDD